MKEAGLCRNCSAHRETGAGMAPQSGAIMARPIYCPAPNPTDQSLKQAVPGGGCDVGQRGSVQLRANSKAGPTESYQPP